MMIVGEKFGAVCHVVCVIHSPAFLFLRLSHL